MWKKNYIKHFFRWLPLNYELTIKTRMTHSRYGEKKNLIIKLWFTVCCPNMPRAFRTRFLHASKSNLKFKLKLKIKKKIYNLNVYLFDSKIPFSRVIVFISPSKNLRNGWTKHKSAVEVNSRSHCPIFCSACPTFVNALPYGPSWPNSPPAYK